MNIARWVLLGLLSLPVVEFYLLIKLGGWLGFIPILLLLLGAAAWGGWLLQTQGLATWHQVQQSLQRGEYPAAELTNAAVILAGGVLLLLPGFLSDIAGLLCLIPPTRRWICVWLQHHRYFSMRTTPTEEADGARIIEGEFRRES